MPAARLILLLLLVLLADEPPFSAAVAGFGAGEGAYADADPAEQQREQAEDLSRDVESPRGQWGGPPRPGRDWAADEDDLLAQNLERGEQLKAERADLARLAPESDDATRATASGDVSPAASDSTAWRSELGSCEG